LTGGVASLFKGNKIRLVSGEAFFLSENEISVYNDNESLKFKFNNAIIATGSRPFELPAFKWSKRVLSSTEVLSLGEIPKRMVVIGGG